MNFESHNTSGRNLMWPMLLGFYFAVRISFTFLWFQAGPLTSSAMSIGIELMLLTGTILYSFGARTLQVGCLHL